MRLLRIPPHIVRDIDIKVTMTIYAHAALEEERSALRKLGDTPLPTARRTRGR